MVDWLGSPRIVNMYDLKFMGITGYSFVSSPVDVSPYISATNPLISTPITLKETVGIVHKEPSLV